MLTLSPRRLENPVFRLRGRLHPRLEAQLDLLLLGLAAALPGNRHPDLEIRRIGRPPAREQSHPHSRNQLVSRVA